LWPALTSSRVRKSPYHPNYAMVGGRIYYVDVQVEALLAHFGDHTTEWYHEEVIAQYDGRDSPGIVFARKDSIVKLKTYGYLCMMDSTHDTYTLGWPLYTIHSYRSTTPRAFFLLRERTPTLPRSV
jgi:hypothetical protein